MLDEAPEMQEAKGKVPPDLSCPARLCKGRVSVESPLFGHSRGSGSSVPISFLVSVELLEGASLAAS